MRKDLLLKEWRKKVKYADEYEIKVGAMCFYNDDDICVLECFADLYVDGELETSELIDLTKNAEGIEKMPASMKRKAKAFVEYFKASTTFENAVQYIDEIIIL